ncbi:TetR/AcrR family transcriptional regulator [Kribbella sp. NBC_00709]|uniref:TetR/AcrR family transcriptional regulator n=1 Tax=Kribbella sp. NBC_00709 TaxID=2975972 RepID=UPI002E2C05DD|nr:helix-turn-helix domain-containing protein [Kribbella sp. NBC_00709]
MDARKPGLRERKKALARRQISDVATRLFLERGYDEVTIADVAEAAGVAKMTVTNYFSRKEDLVFDQHAELVSHAARAISARAQGQSALAALRDAYFAALERQDASVGLAGEGFVEMITGSPALLARLREIDEQREAAIADTLAAETGEPVDDITVAIAAAQLAAVHRVLFRKAMRLTLDGVPRAVAQSVLSAMAARAFDQLQPSLGGYAIR